MTAIVLNLDAARRGASAAADQVAVRTGPATVSIQSAQEALLLGQLLLACAPPRLDRLEATPAVRQREGSAPAGLVIVTDRDVHIIASADTMRRLAVRIDDAGRTGAALDLLRACDQAEALAAHLHRSLN